MRRRVFVVAGEYSANPRHLPPERRGRDFCAAPHPDPADDELTRLFFRYPNKSEDGRARPEDWRREFGLEKPLGLVDLFASAANRALTSLHRLSGGEWRLMLDSITDLFVTSMPGLDPNERMNIGLVPQALRALLGLSPRVRAQYVVGTSDSGAWAFAQAVRAARQAERPATILVVAGQIIPSGYASQYQIRTVLGEADQARGLDMLAVGDLLMDGFRRNLGLSRQQIARFLTRLAERKFQAGEQYPAGILAGRPFKRMTPRTPYFDATDIAVPCCGAAATIVTSDEELARRIAGVRLERYRAAPVTEVLGVGEGSSNENLLRRQSPLLFATAAREAFAATADDARLPLSTFASCAFGVAHDAFPSIELSFLLGMGLSWERSAERMSDGWSNPFGGLLSFGHALGASGLVQVNKAHHLFSGDRRYAKDRPGGRRSGFRESGALAFTTSVGGPLSHVVGSLLSGGFAEVRPPAGRANSEADPTPLMSAWRARRRQLRAAVPAYLGRLRADGQPWLVEGATYVSIRSALRALSPEDIARLTFDGLEALLPAQHLDAARADLRELIGVVLGEADRVASMFDVFRLLTDEVRQVVEGWRARGYLGPKASEGRMVEQVKECLRAPFVLLRGAGTDAATRRRLVFLPAAGLTYAALDDVALLAERPDGALAPLANDASQLPFWNARATRPPGPLRPESELLAGGGAPESAAELELLRLWFAPDPPRPLVARALSQPREAVRGIQYLGEIASRGTLAEPGEAQELLGRAARDARGFLEAFETSLAQVGDLLAVTAFERPPFRTHADEGLIAGARFAREVARAAWEHGIAVRAAVCAGLGGAFDDANGRAALALSTPAQAEALLGRLRAGPARPALAVAGAQGLLIEQLRLRLSGWELDEGASAECAIWRA